MYQYAIYTCISRYSKICWFPVKNCWCQQNSRDVSRDLYIFWIFFRYSIIVPCAKVHHCRICVTDFREGGTLLPPPPHPWAALKKPIWIGLKHDILYFYSNNFEFMLPRANLLLWFSWVFFKSSEVNYFRLIKLPPKSYVRLS